MLYIHCDKDRKASLETSKRIGHPWWTLRGLPSLHRRPRPRERLASVWNAQQSFYFFNLGHNDWETGAAVLSQEQAGKHQKQNLDKHSLRQLQFLPKSCLPQNVCFYVCFLKDFWRWGILQGSSPFNILNSVVQNLAWCAWQPWRQKALYKCIINIII